MGNIIWYIVRTQGNWQTFIEQIGNIIYCTYLVAPSAGFNLLVTIAYNSSLAGANQGFKFMRLSWWIGDRYTRLGGWDPSTGMLLRQDRTRFSAMDTRCHFSCVCFVWSRENLGFEWNVTYAIILPLTLSCGFVISWIWRKCYSCKIKLVPFHWALIKL